MNKIFNLYKNSEDNISKKIKNFYKEYKNVFWITFFLGVIVHLFVLTNKLLNWDEIECLFSKGADFEMGRWFLGATKLIFPNLSMPVLNGILALILLSISTIFIIDILEIKDKKNRILVGGILIVFPTITCTFTYMFTVHSYMLAMLMAVLSAYFAKKDKSKLGTILSIFILVLSLGIYQAYISITATLMLILLIKKTLYEKDWKKIIKQSLKYFAILLISILLYTIICNIFINLLGINLADYQGISNIGKISLLGFIKGIAKSYLHLGTLLFNINGIAPTNILRIICIIFIVLDIIYILQKIFEIRKNKFNFFYSLFLLLLFPVSMNMMYILSPESANHTLLIFGDSFIFISLILLIDKDKKYLSRIIKLLLAVEIFFYAFVANEAYLKMHLAYENTYALCTEIVTTIQNTEGYDEDSKIAIIGYYNSKELTKTYEFDNIEKFIGVAGTRDLINSYSREKFIKYYIGFEGNFIDEDVAKEQLKDNEEYKNMPIYPYNGSIKKIDDIIVVKLSE